VDDHAHRRFDQVERIHELDVRNKPNMAVLADFAKCQNTKDRRVEEAETAKRRADYHREYLQRENLVRKN